MSMFSGMATDATITEDKDYLRGKTFEPLPSDIYNLTIKHAYAAKSKGGAMGINLVMETPEGDTIKDQQWVTSGDQKGNKNFYVRKGKAKKDGTAGADIRNYLPGFSAINSLCKLAIGKELSELSTETKTIKIFNFAEKAEQNTDVEMIMDLVGQKIAAGVLYQIVDKTAKNDAGEYVPTGQVRKVNTVDKYFNAQTRMTTSEITAKLPKGEFAEAWLAKWKDQIDDTSTKNVNPSVVGAPVAAGKAAPKTGLFA